MNNIINAGDSKSWKHCIRRVFYDHRPPEGFKISEDPFEELIKEYGNTHEQIVLRHLGEFVESTSVEHTRALMEDGVPIIYQPSFEDDSLGIVTRPDFLIRKEDGKYQVGDAKLASSLRNHPEIRIQLALYRLLAKSSSPALAFLNGGVVEEVGDEANTERDAFLESMRQILSQNDPPEVYFSESKCTSCPYDSVCRPRFESRMDLSLLYGLDGRSVAGLKGQGIENIVVLASSDPDQIQDIPYLKGLKKKERLVLQAKSYLESDIFQLGSIDLPEGTWIHFDVESNPLSGDLDSEVYLWGLIGPPYRRYDYTYVWSDSGKDQDRKAWQDFINVLKKYREEYPDLRLVHFSSFEVTQIKLYAKRYNMEDNPIVQWLLGTDSPFLDLAKIVRGSLVLPLNSYGLKAICKDKRIVNFQWELVESGSQWSVVRFIEYLRSEDSKEKESIKNEILAYNRDDVVATRALEVWLRQIAEGEIYVIHT